MFSNPPMRIKLRATWADLTPCPPSRRGKGGRQSDGGAHLAPMRSVAAWFERLDGTLERAIGTPMIGRLPLPRGEEPVLSAAKEGWGVRSGPAGGLT